jgi:hypothetical protein
MEVIRGIFVPFEEDEENALMAEFQAAGYEWNGAGIKKFLLDCVFNDEEPEKTPAQEFAETLADALRKNPRAPMNAVDLGFQILKRVRETLRK